MAASFCHHLCPLACLAAILGLTADLLPFHPSPASSPCSGRTIKSLKWFFILSCGLLLVIAAGLVAQGVVFFTSAGLFGTTFPYEVRGGAANRSGEAWLGRVRMSQACCHAMPHRVLMLCPTESLCCAPQSPYAVPHRVLMLCPTESRNKATCPAAVHIHRFSLACHHTLAPRRLTPPPPCRSTGPGTTPSCGTPRAAATCTTTSFGP